MSKNLKEAFIKLGISESASKKEIKTAYTELVKKKHPDKGGDPEEFKRIQEAYDTVTNPPPPQNEHNFQDIFGQVFNSFRVNLNNQNNHTQHETQRLHNITVQLSVQDYLKGHQISRVIEDKQPCKNCPTEGCSDCNSSGMRKMNIMGLYATCPTCQGRGFIFPNNCSVCGGKKYSINRISLKVDISPGTDETKTLQVSQFVFIKLNFKKTHCKEWVLERGKATYKAEVPVLELLCGTTVKVSHPDSELTIKVDNTKLSHIIKGKGVDKGDLTVIIVPIVPKNAVSENMKKAIRQCLLD